MNHLLKTKRKDANTPLNKIIIGRFKQQGGNKKEYIIDPFIYSHVSLILHLLIIIFLSISSELPNVLKYLLQSTLLSLSLLK